MFVTPMPVEDNDPASGCGGAPAARPSFRAIAVTATVVWAATFIVTAGDALLPRIIRSDHFPQCELLIAGGLVCERRAVIVLWFGGVGARSMADGGG